MIKLNKDFIIGCFHLVFIFWTLTGCNNGGSLETKQKKKLDINLHELDERIIFIQKAVAENQTQLIDSLVTIFNSDSIIQCYPFYTLKAYISAYSGSYSRGMFSEEEKEKHYHNLYNKLRDLAIKHNSKNLLLYLDYVKARNFQERDENEKALPMYLSLLPQFRSISDSFAIGLLNKRIGIIYLEVFNEYEKAIKYLSAVYQNTTDQEEKFKTCQYLITCYFKMNNCDSGNYYAQQYLANYDVDTTARNFLNLHRQMCLYNNSSFDTADSVYKYLLPTLIFYTQDSANMINNLKILCGIGAYMEKMLNKKDTAQLARLIKLMDEAEIKNPNHKAYEPSYYYSCYKYYESSGNQTLAFKYLKKYISVKTLNNTEEIKNKVELARIDYETKEKRKSIESENEQHLQKQKIIRNSFIAGSILLVLLIVVLINRNKLKRTVEMERMRSRLSRDLHDDIGSTLSSINILSRTAQTNLQQMHDEKTKASLEKINERSQRLLDNMKDIIWNINPGNDTIEEVMSRMREYATTILEAKNIEYTFNFPKEKFDCTLTMEVKSNMYLIFKEAVNNLVKYSGCSKANLSLTFDEKNIHLIIEDNGKGFNENEIQHRGGLRNMKQRAKEINGSMKINSTIEMGTSIELTMPRYF